MPACAAARPWWHRPEASRISRLDVTGFDPDLQRAEIDVTCSKGTYVRQIAADIGEAAGAGGYCLTLRRVAIGPWQVADAGTPAEIAADPTGRWFRTPLETLAHLPDHQMSADERDLVIHGRTIDQPAGAASELTRLSHDGRLVAVAEPRAGQLHPVVVLA